MVHLIKEHYTVDDYEQWEGKWELIEGTAYAMSPAAIGKHQWVAGRIVSFLNKLLEECNKCFVVSEAEWRLSRDTILRPDVMVMCGELVNYFSDRPEIVFEVISPSTRLRDEITKKELYRLYKVPYYALVYIDEERVEFFRLENGEYRKSEPTFNICGIEIELDIDYIFRKKRG